MRLGEAPAHSRCARGHTALATSRQREEYRGGVQHLIVAPIPQDLLQQALVPPLEQAKVPLQQRSEHLNRGSAVPADLGDRLRTEAGALEG